ncbi:MAG: LamG domain-containing protein [Methylococcaceae bacterium]
MKTLKHIPPTPFKGGFFTSLLALCLSMGISQNANADLKDGLVAHWSFDDCRATDNSGNGHDGTLGGNPQCVDGVKGKAFSLDGVDDYFNVENSPLFNVDKHSIVTSIKSSVGGIIIGKVNPWTYEAINLVLNSENSKLHTSFATDYEVNHAIESVKTIADDKWHFVAMIYDGAFIKFYIDGILDSSYPRTGTVRTNNNDLAIGRHGGAANGNDGFFNGLIDDTRIYNRALTEAEVMELYNGGGVEEVVKVPEVLNVEPWDAIKNKYTVFTVSGLNLTQDNIEFELDDCVTANRDEEKNFLFRDTIRKFRCMPTSTGEKRGRIYDTKTGKLLNVFEVKVMNPPAVLGGTVTISGQIKLSSQVAKGVFLSPSDDSVTGCATDNNGKFSCKVPKNWTGVLTPKSLNVRFSPALFSVNQPKKNLKVNFVGVTADVFPLNGVIPTDWKNSNWSIDTSNGSQEDKTAYEGRFSLKATPKANKPVTIETTVNVPFYETVQIEFARRLTGGSLKFYVDGILKKEWSGQSDWVLERFPIFNVDSFLNLGTAMLPKTHTFKWEYTGNSSAWIDNVNYPSFLTQSGTTCENATAGTLKLMTISKPNCEQLESYLVWLKVIRPSKLKAANVFSQQIEGIASNNETAMNAIDWGSKAIGYVANPLLASKEGFAKNKLVGQVMADFFSYPCNNLESKAQEEACKTAISQTIDLGITVEIEGTKSLGLPYAYLVEKGLIAGVNLYNAGKLYEPTKKLNNSNLADYFLDDYYKSGGSLETLRTLYKVKSTSMIDLVDALAINKGYSQPSGLLNSPLNPFASYDYYTTSEVISEIEEAKKLSSALRNLKLN